MVNMIAVMLIGDDDGDVYGDGMSYSDEQR